MGSRVAGSNNQYRRELEFHFPLRRDDALRGRYRHEEFGGCFFQNRFLNRCDGAGVSHALKTEGTHPQVKEVKVCCLE